MVCTGKCCLKALNYTICGKYLVMGALFAYTGIDTIVKKASSLNQYTEYSYNNSINLISHFSLYPMPDQVKISIISFLPFPSPPNPFTQ